METADSTKTPTPSKSKEAQREEKAAKKAEMAAKREQREALKQEKEMKKEAKRVQEEAKRREKEAAEKKKQDALEKQKSMMHKFMSGFKPVIREEKPAAGDTIVVNPQGPSGKVSEKTETIDQQLTQELTEQPEDILRMHLQNWKAMGKSHTRWGLRRAPKLDVFKELKLQGANDPSSSTQACEQGEDPSSSNQNLAFDASDPSKRKLRMKLLQFAKCFRPAYYGTFSKQSNTIRPRRPLGKDSSLDYEVDSDEEWEEEEPGESLSVCDEEEEAEKMDAEEESGDDFVVPDGYLSENEGVEVSSEDNDEKDEAGKGKKQVELSGETMEEHYAILASRTERALKSNTPYIVCNFPTSSNEPPVVSKTRESCLQALSMRILSDDVSIQPVTDEPLETQTPPKSTSKRQRKSVPELPENMVAHMVNILQESPQGMKKTVDAVSQRFPGVPKSRVETKIREISVYADNRWKVKEEILHMYQAPKTKAQALEESVIDDEPAAVGETTKLFRKRCLPLEDNTSLETLGA